jgi:hypothetical protein
MLAALPLLAKPVPADDVAAAARGWLNLNQSAPLEAAVGTTLDFLAPVPGEDGEILYYVATLDQGGTLVVSGDDALEPVIAFSEKPLDVLNLDPCNHLRLMLDHDVADRLAASRAGVVKSASDKPSKWAALIAADRDPLGVKARIGSVSDVRVSPLTATKWSQSYVYQGYTRLACYNYYTPKFTPGAYQNYVCGCVATALAQIMRYHQHPKTGVGTASYSIQVDNDDDTRKLKGGNGSGGRYDWANMVADPAALAKAGKLTQTQRMAIGYLCHDAGVASHMRYTSGSSSAILCGPDGTHALQTVFKYASVDSPWINSGTFLKKDINSALNPCLDAGLPCAMTIRADKGGIGHAIVADGYGYAYGTLYHHLNLGWGGSDTAWYNLPLIDTSTYAYTRVDGLLFNIHPSIANVAIISGRIVDSANRPLAGVKVLAKDTAGILPNKAAFSNAKGIYSMIVPAGEYKVVGSLAGYGFTPQSRTVTAGYGSFRNSWNNTFKRVTRIMRLSTTKLQFGQVPVGTSKTLRFKVFNDGSASLKLGEIETPAGFDAQPLETTVTAYGGEVVVKVTFTPGATGLVKGELTILSNRSGGVSQLVVAGTGI